MLHNEPATMCHDEVENYFNVLRSKWDEIPYGELSRASSKDLLQVAEQEIASSWEYSRRDASTGNAYSVRGWYHDLYRDVLAGKSVLDVGSGFGIDGITFAEAGAHVTFLDIVEENLQLVERICRHKEIDNVAFHYMSDIDSLAELDTFDVIWCQGSLINAPFDVIRAECQALVSHLRIGGRWIELAYPKIRWEREGQLPFKQWGARTDGGAPWIEWYDLEKLFSALHPAQFDVVLHFEFHNGDFNWFDLKRVQ